jgi:hypothetical protein
VAVAALAFDLTAALGLPRLPPEALAELEGRERGADRNRLMLGAVSVWLLAEPWFASATLASAALAALLVETAAALGAAAPAARYTTDPDRREELARTALAAFGYHPAGETPVQAADRLTAVSGAERRRLLAASRAADERARAVREALIAKAAQESADKWTRD